MTFTRTACVISEIIVETDVRDGHSEFLENIMADALIAQKAQYNFVPDSCYYCLQHDIIIVRKRRE